jgi:putative membrane protein
VIDPRIEAERPDPSVPLAQMRTSMASYRTLLALDRTALAWIRTTLAMASFGFGMVAFFRGMEAQATSERLARLHQGAVWFGMGILLVGIIAMVVSSGTYWRAYRKLLRDEAPELTHWPMSITVALLTAVIGVAGFWMLLKT